VLNIGIGAILKKSKKMNTGLTATYVDLERLLFNGSGVLFMFLGLPLGLKGFNFEIDVGPGINGS
jgi:hypothetical protein